MIRNGARRVWTWHEGVITALAFGGFFIILGSIFAFTPGIYSKTDAFFRDITNVYYSLGKSNTISLLAPANPAAHIDFFSAVMNFCLAIGILQVVILALRIFWKSPVKRIADTVGNLLFWIGATVVANFFLLAGTQTGWFQFWSLLILLAGLSLIARAFVHLATRSRRQTTA